MITPCNWSYPKKMWPFRKKLYAFNPTWECFEQKCVYCYAERMRSNPKKWPDTTTKFSFNDFLMKNRNSMKNAAIVCSSMTDPFFKRELFWDMYKPLFDDVLRAKIPLVVLTKLGAWQEAFMTGVLTFVQTWFSGWAPASASLVFGITVTCSDEFHKKIEPGTMHPSNRFKILTELNRLRQEGHYNYPVHLWVSCTPWHALTEPIRIARKAKAAGADWIVYEQMSGGPFKLKMSDKQYKARKIVVEDWASDNKFRVYWKDALAGYGSIPSRLTLDSF